MSAPVLDPATLEAAAQWYVDLRTGPPDESLQRAHQHWLESDPRHLLAWERLGRLQGKLERLAPAIGSPTLRTARAKRRQVLKVLSLLLASGAAGTLGWRTTALPQWAADQRTGTGERRDIHLEDGSRLYLNTATAVNIRYGAQLREILLLSGEILIQTAKDKANRPLIVHTAEGSLQALGTRFIVQQEADQTRLTVLEHAVRVRPGELPNSTLTVEAGEQVSFKAHALGTVTPATAQADAWLRDTLVVNGCRLDEFLGQLQRYRPGYLSCDPQVAGLRVSGSFHLHNTDNVLENLRLTLPVRLRRFTRYWVRFEAA